MKQYLKVLIPLLIFTLTISACRGQKRANVSNYNFPTICMGTELDGTYTLKVWGNGRNASDALEQAKKNAVRDIIFKGITKGINECNPDPILLEPNSFSKYEEYFYTFFIDGGEYANYVTLKDEKFKNKLSRKFNGQSESVAALVRVDRRGLKQKLKQDNIYK